MAILYFIETENGATQVSTDDTKKFGIPVTKIFEQLCLQELTTLKGRIDAVKKLFDYKYNVPVFVNSDLLFFKVRDEKIYWINFVQISSIIKTKIGTDFAFKDGTLLKTKANYRSSLNAYKKTLKIYDC
ncbi:MAG TPA: competence protein ComK [Bacilli bacterium]